MNSVVGYVGAIILTIGIGLGVARGCDMMWNNRTIQSNGATTISRATGISGHREFTRYDSGAMDVKIYADFGHRLFSSKLYQDLNGDAQVDVIREQGSEWTMHRLKSLLLRETDYTTEKARFDQADKVLETLINQYPENGQ